MKRQDLNGFAIDLGGTKTTAARIANGDITERVTLPTDRDGDLYAQLDQMNDMLSELDYYHGAPLGVAVTGRLTRDKQWFAVNAATLPKIWDAPLGDALSARFQASECCNDAIAATLAEALFGAGIGCQDFAYITVSTGVGGGLYFNGRPVSGFRGLAGHFGFMTSPLAQETCGSGRKATVESVAGGLAISEAADKTGHRDFSAKDVFVSAQMGAGWATKIVDQSAQAIATLIADISTSFDPERVAVGGSIGLADGYLSLVESHLANEPELFQASLTLAQLGQDGPLLGALALRQQSDHAGSGPKGC
ncbi:ROK family protein [Aliiroseovarius sp. 2305UL8-7]|uniref:ROK family protein n=1 Tax=Aliiroseovarius conchicola TaxID=3121637 RepID=UPI003528C888